MEQVDVSVGVFANHTDAEKAVQKLSLAGFPIKKLTIIGKGFHSEEAVSGFYNIGDRMKFWGKQGAFWGGFWGLFFGGVFVNVPVVGQVVVLGYLATTLISVVESAVVVGGVSALGAALYSIGIPKDSIIAYEASVKADGFMILVHGTEEEAIRAKSVLALANSTHVETHTGTAGSAVAGQWLEPIRVTAK